MRRGQPFFAVRLLLAVFCCAVAAEPVQAFPFQKHLSFQRQYIWGVSTEASREIHSAIIDTVPWKNGNHAGGWGHRELWGHSDDWFYRGILPKEEVLQDIQNNVLKAHPEWSEKMVQKEVSAIYKEAVSMTGQERIATELGRHYPHLPRSEAMALAEQIHASHVVGDSQTSAGVGEGVDLNKWKEVLKSPTLTAVRAQNETMIAEAAKNGVSAAKFVGQARNFERLKAEQIMREMGCEGYNPPSRYDVGFVKNGQNYVVKAKMYEKSLRNALARLPKDDKIVLPDDEYEKFIRSKKTADLADRVIPESQVTGKPNTRERSQQELAQVVEKDMKDVTVAKNKMLAGMREKLKRTAPYMLGGAMMALSENWNDLSLAYRGESSWERVLKRTAVDFAGYTVTPMLVDGVLCRVGKRFAAVMPLKNAGMGYTIGYFCWGMGKEFYAYQNGDISYEVFAERARQRGKNAVGAALMVPVNMLVLKIVVAAGATPLFVPVVIVGGGIAIQRAQEWYEQKKWEDTIYLEDLVAFLGEELIREFTLLDPARYPSLAAPERRDNLAEPEGRHSLIEPERRGSLIDVGVWAK